MFENILRTENSLAVKIQLLYGGMLWDDDDDDDDMWMEW